MDLNYLLYRHQVSVMRADAAAGCEARTAHSKMAKAYAGRIAILQADNNAAPMLHTL